MGDKILNIVYKSNEKTNFLAVIAAASFWEAMRNKRYSGKREKAPDEKYFIGKGYFENNLMNKRKQIYCLNLSKINCIYLII